MAEVIESTAKPSKPWGKLGQTACGQRAPPVADMDSIIQTILAIGEQDTDPRGLQAPAGIDILGASSDHLIVNANQCYQPVGSEILFQLNYSAMVRAMTSPSIENVMLTNDGSHI